MSDSVMNSFRHECRNYTKYLEQRDGLLKELYLTQSQISGVHSVDTSIPPIEGKEAKSILKKIETKDQILQKLNEINLKIHLVEDTVTRIDYPFYRVVVWEKFVMNRTFKEIGEKYAVDSENLRKRVNKALLAVLLYN